MEHWQVTHIQKNLYSLVTNTECSSLFLAILQTRGALSDSDIEELDTVLYTRGRISQSKRFFEIIMRKKCAYDSLIEALRDTGQTAVEAVLTDTPDFQSMENSEITIRKENSSAITKLHGTDISYIDDHVLGQGACSIVYSGYYRNIPAAVKRTPAEYVDVYKNELDIWQAMKTKVKEQNEISVNIVDLYYCTSWNEGGRTSYYMALELANCDLGTRIKHMNILKTKFDPTLEHEQQKLPIFIHHAGKGLKWIHDHNIIHRDIKPENILIFKNLEGREIAKLGDFGISKKIRSSTMGTTANGAGTSDWMSPEALNAVAFQETFMTTKKVDIFSLGVTAHFTISLGIHPFGQSKKYGKFIHMNILQDEILPATLESPNYAANHLFQWMMAKKANKRPDIFEVLQHPFFWNYEQSKNFLLEVAICFAPKNDLDLKFLKSKINEAYRQRTKALNSGSSWKLKMNGKLAKLLTEKKSARKAQYYDENSILSLVKFIRDAYVHFPDIMSDEMITRDEYFGDASSFSAEKYINAFLTAFPDLVVFLYCILSVEVEMPQLHTLRDKYFSKFNEVPMLADPVLHSDKC